MQHNGGTFFKSSYIWGGTALDIGKCLSQGKTRASHLIAALELLSWASGQLAYLLLLWKGAFVPALTGGTLHGLWKSPLFVGLRNPISEAEGEYLIDSMKKWNSGVSLFPMEIFSEVMVGFVKAPWKKWVWRRGIKALSWLFAQLPSSLGPQILFTFLFFHPEVVLEWAVSVIHSWTSFRLVSLASQKTRHNIEDTKAGNSQRSSHWLPWEDVRPC